MRVSIAERLLRRRVVTDAGCWEYQGNRAERGYGRIGLGGRSGRTEYVHRVAWATFVGPIPKGANVLHSCDNPPCFNPEHLFLGDQTDNMRDAAAKGRTARQVGEANPRARLTASDAQAIRGSTETGVDLAKRFGISPQQVSLIRKGKRWATA